MFWSFFSIDIVYVYIAGALAASFSSTTRVLALQVLAAFVLGKLILVKFLGLPFPKARPYQQYHFTPVHSGLFSSINERPNSFPSGHTASLVAISIVLFVFNPVLGMLSGLCSLVTIYGRLLLGYHFFTDILGGLVVGVVTALLVLQLFSLYGSVVFW